MVYEIEKEVKSNEFINFKHVKDYFNSYYIDQIYKKNESDKKEEAIRAQNEFKKILEYLPKEFDSVLSQWQNSGHLKKYFWIKMKYKDCGRLPSSISIFLDKLGFKVVIESDFDKNYINHNRYLDELKKNKKDLKDIIYFPLLGGELKSLSSITNIDSDLKKVSNGEYDTLQAGYFKSYGDLKKEFNTLDKVPLTDIIIWIYKCIDILRPYYEKCIEAAKENIVESEVTSDILATNIQIKEEYTPLEYFENINFNGDFKIENLYYEDTGLLEKQISKSLKNGKHIILTGPPGTGKSKLAKEICNYYKANYKMTTALADWSTYDTIGGYSSSKDGSLYFQPGIFLSCFKDSKTNKKNEWLIIDEMNRADIDKAFGVFFSALTGDSVDLSFKGNNNENIKVFNEKDKKETNLENEYIIPTDFRLIGTINSFDKTSLFEMSYAFMRRFAFIPVTVPKNINSELIEKYLNIWNISKEDWLLNGLSELWEIINKYRKIGPAILEDIARYLESEEDFSSAITLYVLPQFEGLDEEGFQQFIKDILNINIIKDKSIIISFLQDFFGYIYKE